MPYVVGLAGSLGGSGKTTLAVQLAQCFDVDFGAQSVVIDANTPVSCHVQELLHHVDVEDYLAVMGNDSLDAVVHDEPSNLRFISVFGDTQAGESWSGLKHSLENIIARFDYIVVDFGGVQNSINSQLLDLCHSLLVVTDGTHIGLNRLKKDYAYLCESNHPSAIIKAVVNKADTHQISEDWVAASTGIRDVYLVDNDKQRERSDRFVPYGTTKSKEFRQAIRKIAALSETIQGGDDFGHHDEEESEDVRLERERELKKHIHRQLVEIPELKHIQMEHTDIDWNSPQFRHMEDRVREEAIKLLNKSIFVRDRDYRNKLVDSLVAEALRLGPLEELLNDDDVSEIMVNRWDSVFIEREGKIQPTKIRFLSDEQLSTIIERIVRPLGRRVDLSSPYVNARLQDGSRVNIIIPPLSVNGSAITIRKFSKDPLEMSDLIVNQSLNEQMSQFLDAAVQCRLNIMISGGTGSGKTTLLNIMSSFIPDDERILTVEDTAELQLRQPHVVSLESRPPNVEGRGGVSIRDLIANSLRMRPDRIIVGECREGEALDMLQAMNTGHDGSMTTLHANSTKEMLSRLETLVMFAETDLSSMAIRSQIAGALDLVVQIGRLKDGRRKILQVSEIRSFENGSIQYNDIFVFQQKRRDKDGRIIGEFVSTGYMPLCLERFRANSIDIPKEIFWQA